MTKRVLTFFLMLLYITTFTACKSRLFAPGDDDTDVTGNSTETDIQYYTYEGILKSEDTGENTEFIQAQRNTLLTKSGKLFFGSVSSETDKLQFRLLANSVPHISLQPSTDDNASPMYQIAAGPIGIYNGDEDSYPQYLYQPRDSYSVSGEGLLIKHDMLFITPQNGLYKYFPQEEQGKAPVLSGYTQEELAIAPDEFIYLDNDVQDAAICVGDTRYHYFKLDTHNLLYFSTGLLKDGVSNSDYAKKSPKYWLCSDVTKFQANYYRSDSKALQVCYLSNDTLYFIEDFSSIEKDTDINGVRTFENVKDFWRGPEDSIIYQKLDGSVYIFWPEGKIYLFTNIDRGISIKEFAYFPSKKGLDYFQYAYIDMKGTLYCIGAGNLADTGDTAVEMPNADDITALYGTEIPIMTPEKQEYFDKYMAPFSARINPFFYDFSENSFKYFSAAFVYSGLTKPTKQEKVPADIVESLVGKYFPISSEQMKELESRYAYVPDTDTYTIAEYMSIADSKTIKGVLLNHKLNDNILTLECIWYSVTPDGTQLTTFSQTGIELFDDYCIYKNNKVIKY